MLLATAQQAVAIGQQIDECNALIEAINAAGAAASVLTSMTVVSTQGPSPMVLPSDLQLTAQETLTVAGPLLQLLQARLAAYTAALAAL